MSEAETKTITLNGAELAYSVHGAGNGTPPLLFVHGFAMRSTGAPYAELLDRLAERYTVYALDLRGHGASAQCLDAWSFETLADDVAAFADTLGPVRPAYVGHSFGCIIGLYAEIRHPGTLASLSLLSPGPADHRSDPPEALDFMIEHGRNRDILRGGFARMFVKPQDLLLEQTLDAVTLLDSGVHRALKACNPSFSIDDQLKDVTAPVLLLCGERDTVVPPALQHDMARKLLLCKEVVFSTEGHMLPNESAAIAAREIFAFLDHDSGTMATAS